MKKLLTICAVAALMLSVTDMTQAANITVPGDYTTIQLAIVGANPGDTIIVAAGTYDGFNVASGKSGINILGAQYDIDPEGTLYRGAADDSDESVITGTITIKADNVILNGFKMTSSYVAVGYTHAHNVSIIYNIFENVTATYGAIHLHGGTHEADGGYIGYNTISNAAGHGIWTVSNDDVVIEYNHVLGGTGNAIEALNHVGTGIVIHGNTITNPGQKGINYWGVLVRLSVTTLSPVPAGNPSSPTARRQ